MFHFVFALNKLKKLKLFPQITLVKKVFEIFYLKYNGI